MNRKHNSARRGHQSFSNNLDQKPDARAARPSPRARLRAAAAAAYPRMFEPLETRRLLTTYYVNDNWMEQVNSAPGGTAGVVEPGDIVQSGSGDPAMANLVFDTQAFASVQSAADKFFVTGADTIQVLPGTYAQPLNLVDTPGAHAAPLDGLTIRGAQAGVDARTRTGASESIITTDATQLTSQLWYINANAINVTIDGFTFDGNGAAGGGVTLLDGATDSNAARGLVVDSNGVNVTNNIVTNFYRRGVQYGFGSSPSGGVASQNSFDRIGSADQLPDYANSGYAFLAFGAPSFIDNKITNAHNGAYWIQVYPPAVAPITVSNNEISGTLSGITLNETSVAAPVTTITDNDITITDSGGVGVVLWTVGNPLNFADNTITTTAANTYGVEVWAGAAGVPVNVTLTDSSISGFSTGVHVANAADVNGEIWPAMASANINLTGMSITMPAGGTGVFVEDTATADTAVSASLGAGTIINGAASGTGVKLSGAAATLAGDTLGPVALAGFTGTSQFVVLADGAYAGDELDGTGASYNGVAGGATLAALDGWAIEDRITHRIDASATGTGLVRIRAGNVYVTPDVASVQRGIDVASPGDVVNVQGGTYIVNLSIGKAVTIDGEGTGPGMVSFVPGTGNPLVRITSTNAADDITLRDIAFNGINGAVHNSYGILANATENFDTLSVLNSTFSNFLFDAISINGDSVNGLSAHNVVLSDLAFAGNGADGNGGAGDISLFLYNGDASFTNLTLVGSAVGNTGARLGIQLRGVGAGTGVSEKPIGNVSFDNVDISGNYRTSFLGIQRYSSVAGLSFNDVALGGATSNVTGTFGSLLRFDAVGSGTVSSPASVDLGNTHFRGLASGSAQQSYLEFAPDNTFAFLRADATGTVWEGTAANALTLSQLFAAEDRILDYVKELPSNGSFKGWAQLRTGQEFITPNSKLIQRAIDMAGAGDTVIVQAGTYATNFSINKTITIDGEGSGPGLVTFTPAVNGGAIVSITSTNGADNATLRDIAFNGINGSLHASYGVTAAAPANFGTLDVQHSSFSGFLFDAVNVAGDTVNGISPHNVVLNDLTFSNNGTDGGSGAGDISLFTYNGNATLTNLALAGSATATTGARFGIQIRGVGGADGSGLKPIGNVTLDNIDISGDYRTSFLGFQRYSTVGGLSLNDVKLGGATSNVTGTFGDLLRFDGVGTGSVASPATVDLGNTHFRGLSPTSTQQSYLEFAPDNNFAFLRADATDTVWDLPTGGANLTAGAFTLSQAFEAEDRVLDYVKNLPSNGSFKGWAVFQSGQEFITPNSPLIQRAIDMAGAGDTVNVAAGNYAATLAINKSITIDGEGSGSSPLANFIPASTNPLVSVTSTSAADDVTIRDIAFHGVNGSTVTGYGIWVNAPANFDTLAVERSTFDNFRFDAVSINGDTVNGISAHNVVLTDLSFSNNGTDGGGGAGDVSLFTYNGDATFTNLTLVGSATATTGARIGIQFRGVGAGNGASEKPMGDVSLNNIDISGNYRTSFLGIQRYSDVSGLTFTDVALGSATSNVTGTFGALLRFDAVGSGTISSPATVDLGNTHFRGLDSGSAQPTYLEFAPDNNFAFLRADATGTIWEGTAAGALSLTQAYAAEDRILDYQKNFAGGTFKGWAELQNGKAFVTPTAAGPISGNVISRAAEVVDSGGTVYIAPGTYTENVSTGANNVRLSPDSGTGIVTIDGSLTLDGDDALAIVVDGLAAGSQHGQFIVNGTVTLGGATLDTGGSSISATPGQTLSILVNDLTDAVGGFFAAPGNGNGNVVLVNGQPFFVFYNNNGGANDITLSRAPNGTPVGPQAAPTVVYVDDDWAALLLGNDADGAGAALGNGVAFGIDQFASIQDAINAVAPGGEIRIYGGSYTQSIVVDKPLRLLGYDAILSGTVGDGNNDAVIAPSGTVTNAIEVNASNVEIAGLLLDGNTTDSRGIEVTSATESLSGIDIHGNLVRNFNRRGIQIDNNLASFDIHDNVVQNVAGAADAIGISNIGGGGLSGAGRIRNNIVTGSTIGIGLQESTGVAVSGNQVTMVAGGIGIRDTHAGAGVPAPSGATDTFVNNTISGGDAASYGLIVVSAAMDTLVQGNSVTTPGTGMGAYGHIGATVPTATFSGNTITADLNGIEISTDTFGFDGAQSVSAVITANDIAGANGAGILVIDTDGAGSAVAAASINGNTASIHGNFIGIDVAGGVAQITGNNINNNTTGIRVRNAGNATLTSNTFNGNSIGLLAQAGNATITNTQRFDGIGIGNGSLVTVVAGGSTLLVTTSLTINGTGKLDLNDNDMILNYSGASQLAAIQALINTGRNGGTWLGNGITSTAARNNPAANTTLAAMEASQFQSIYGIGATFDGEALDGTMVLVKYTYYGDTDFNGVVNFDDYVRTDNGFNNHLTGWMNGDFDGNGVVNFDDYVLIDLAFNTQGAALRGGGSAGTTTGRAPVGGTTTGGAAKVGAAAGNTSSSAKSSINTAPIKTGEIKAAAIKTAAKGVGLVI